MELTEQQKLDQASASVDEKARLETTVTYGYQNLFPIFKEKLANMSANQLRRAWLASMLFPLNDKPPRHSYKIEEEAYSLATKLDEYKYSMLLLGVDRHKELLNAPVPSTSDQSSDTTTETSVPSSGESGDGSTNS